MSKREQAVPEMAERLWLAAVGKHPGWNDHLDDIGLDMDRLVAVKRQLYVDGIGGLIGSGTWESMDDSARDEGFAHSFLWRQPDGLVVGRMWSSSDGKGRRKYPMIVCAQCRSLPLAFVGGPVLDRLRRLEEQCKAVSTAAEVISAVDRMRGELRELASYTPSVTGGAFEGEAAAAKLADAEVMGPEGRGLTRVLYQMEREMAAYLRPEAAATGSRSRTLEVRAQHMRLPSVFEPEHACWSAWSRLLLGRVDQLAPLLLVNKDGRPWVDVIVGEPGVTQLACLQGSTEAFPLTTDIPFTIDEETERAGRELIEKARRGEIHETDPGFFDAPSDRLAPFLKMARRPSREGGANKKQVMLAAIAAAAVLVVVVVLAVLFFGGGEGEQAGGREQSSAPREPDPAGKEQAGIEGVAEPERSGSAGESPANPDAGPAGERLDRFRAWCTIAERWYLPFVAAIDLDEAAADAHLARAVVGPIRNASAGRPECNPLEASPGRYRSITALSTDPPDSMIEPTADPVVGGALRHIEAVLAAIGPGAWPAHGALDHVLGALGGLGVESPSALGAIRDDLASGRGEEAARGVSAMLTHRNAVVRLHAALAARSEAISGLRSAGAAEQASWYEALAVAGEAQGVTLGAWLADTVARCERVAGFGGELVARASQDLPRIDESLLAGALVGVTGASPEADLRAWLAALSDRSLYLLDPSDDPRRVLADAGGLEGVGVRLNALLDGHDDAAASAIAAEVEAWRAESASVNGLTWNEANSAEIERRVEQLVARRGDLLERIDAAERDRRYEIETYRAELRAIGSVSTTGSEVIDGVWIASRDALIERYGDDTIGLSREIETLTAALGEVERAMPPLDVEAAHFGRAASKASALLEDTRETRLGEAAARWNQPGAVGGAVEAYAAWRDDVSRSAETARGMIAACDGWMGLGDRVGDETFGGLLAGWASTWLGGRVDLAEIDPRLDLIREFVLPGARGGMAGLVADAAAPVEVVHTAWIGLGDADPSWPENRDELVIEAAAVARLRDAIGTLAPARRGEVEGVLTRESALRWTRVASASEGWAAFRDLAPLVSAMGVSPSALPPELGFDLLVAWLLDEIEGDDALDADRVLTEVERWLGPEAGLDGHLLASDWLESMHTVLVGRETGDVDFRSIGPARAGWEGVQHDSGRQLTYSWLGGDSRPRSLKFRLVESPETGAFYLSETEAPAWLLFEYALASPGSALVVASMEADWTPLDDTRAGPRVWTWRQQGGVRSIQLSRSWTARSRGGPSAYYAPTLLEEIGRPGPGSPLQRVSPRAAAVLVALTGCRLPTAAEWAAALASLDNPGPSDDWNLRDQAFEAQRAHMAGAARADWPDMGAFVPDEVEVSRGADAQSHEWTDGTLWFDEVGFGRKQKFYGLIGNVAEYVLSGSGVAELMTDRHGDPMVFAGGVAGGADRSGAFSVIGGSALSAPELPLTRAYRLDGAVSPSGFSDVGFRLAFSPGAEPPLVVQIGELVRAAPFLRPPD